MTDSTAPVRIVTARRRPHVVIIGGGVAGLSTIRALRSLAAWASCTAASWAATSRCMRR